VSTSVQAYFALKLAGTDPSDERLTRARREIRRLGGADAADALTRFFLALFGQIGYDHCPAMPPERLLLSGVGTALRVPLSIVWSHRPVRDVGVERGVRELFVRHPRDWPAAAIARSVRRFAIGPFERWGWIPLRRRALERAEAELVERLRPGRLEQLDFFELLWHSIAMHTIGYPPESDSARACEERLRAMVVVDAQAELARPRLRMSPSTDTAIVLRALHASGVPLDHPAMCRALEWLVQSRSSEAPLDVARPVYGAIFLAAHDPDVASDDALPPVIEINDDYRGDEEHRACDAAAIDELRNAIGLPEAFDSPIAALRSAQAGDGSWTDSTNSGSIEATATAVCRLAAAGGSESHEAMAAGTNWLVVHQQPSGGWGECALTNADAEPQACRPTASHTAFALVALVAAGKANNLAARRAVQFLIETQEDDGRWKEPHFATHDAATGRWYGNNLYSAAWPLLALSRWAVAATAEQRRAGDSISLRLVVAS
jgi:squalene-hopene/tetraprenyl-beta-curcumene cyclase